jgi:hypothetical protein
MMSLHLPVSFPPLREMYFSRGSSSAQRRKLILKAPGWRKRRDTFLQPTILLYADALWKSIRPNR